MANELLMPVRYNGDNVGISVVVSNLDEACSYNKILISLDDREYEVNVSGDKTDIVTFNNLDQNCSYNIKALLDIDGELVELNIKTVPSVISNISNPLSNNKRLCGCASNNSIRCGVRIY